MFLEYGDLLLRMEAAKLAGFSAYEVAFPYDASIEDLQKAQSELGISLELINTFPGLSNLELLEIFYSFKNIAVYISYDLKCMLLRLHDYTG